MVGRPRRGDAGPAWAGGTPVGEERANGMPSGGEGSDGVPSGGERSDGLRAGGTRSEGMTSGGERADGERAAEAARGLVVSGARVTFAGQESPALDDVDVTVDAGRVLAVLGPQFEVDGARTVLMLPLAHIFGRLIEATTLLSRHTLVHEPDMAHVAQAFAML